MKPYLRRAWAPFSRLNEVDWAQLHAKAAGAAWAVTLFVFTPNLLGASLGSVLIWVMTALTLAGATVSSVGLVLAARGEVTEPTEMRATLRRTIRGMNIELLGLAWMVIGVLLYFTSQGVLSFGPAGDQRIALTVFAYFMAAMLVGRVASVLHRRRKETRVATAIGAMGAIS